jgi:hypothetical protein
MELQKIIKKIALPIASSVRDAILVYDLPDEQEDTRIYRENGGFHIPIYKKDWN